MNWTRTDHQTIRILPSEHIFRYLPSSPYQENTTLQTYAGMCCLYINQLESEQQLELPAYSQDTLDKRSLALTYFDRALALDPSNVIAASFADKLRNEDNDLNS